MRNWIKNGNELDNMLREKELAFVMVAPAEERWNEGAKEAADLIQKEVGANAELVFVDPAEAPEYCDDHQIMHMFTLVAYQNGEEVDRQRITQLKQVGRFIKCHLTKPACTIINGMRTCVCYDEMGYPA